LQEILKRHNAKPPFLTKGAITKNVEMKYNVNLVKVDALLKLDREIWGKKKIDQKWVEGFHPISDLFSSLFATPHLDCHTCPSEGSTGRL
jgi:hypothetical protein